MIRRPWGWVLFLWLVSCGNGSASRQPQPDPAGLPSADSLFAPPASPPEVPTAPPAVDEVLESETASVEEAALRAAFVEQGLEVRVPLDKLVARALSGEIELALLDASGAAPTELARGSVEFAQSEEREVHEVLLRGVPDSWARGQTAPIVVEWKVRISDDATELAGKRSLYSALGPLEVQLRGPTQLSDGEGAPLRVIVRHRRTGALVEGAHVSASLFSTALAEPPESLPLFEGETDAFGEFVEQLAFPSGVNGGQIRVEVTNEDGQVWTSATISITGEQRLHLGSDKTIYKPGQTVELRALALAGPDREPVANTEAIFEAYDGKGLKVFKRTVSTDDFGVASVSVPTDTRVNEGSWSFQAHVAGVSQSLELPIRQYILPKMAVDVTTEVPYALPGEVIRGQVDARYLFGEPVANARVWLTAGASGFSMTLEGTTDVNGLFPFEIVGPAAIPLLQPLAISVSVRDSADQEQTASGQVQLSPAAVLVELLQEQSPVVRGVPNRLLVLVSDPLGRPLVSDLTLTGLEAEPVDASTTALGIAAVPFTPSDEPSSVGVQAVDGAGRVGTATLPLAPVEKPALHLRADRALYTPGDEATLEVRADRDVERAYVDLFRGVVGVESVTVELTGGHGELAVPITADMGGMLLADAFVPLEDGSTLGASAHLLVESDERLRVALVPSGESFFPGEEAGIEVQVTDAQGNPRVAAVGLSVVNEATFALGGEPSANLERAFSPDSPFLPSSVAVLGQNSLDLLNMPPSNDRQLLARSLFARSTQAAVSPMLPRFDYSSRATELPVVLSLVQGKVTMDGSALVNALRPVFDGTEFTPELWFETVERHAKRLRDPFGQPYRVAIDVTSQLMTLECSGPDEERRTDDDVAATVSVYLPSPPPLVLPGGGVGPAGTNVLDPAQGAAPLAPAAAPGTPVVGFAAEDAPAGAPGVTPERESSTASPGVAVRTDFRETVFSNPSLVTDENGVASVSFPLAHSISTWRASAESSTADGRVGTGRTSFRTFQSFFVDFDMPTDLTRGDELELPVIVYTYLAEQVEVEVSFEAGEWVELLTAGSQQVTLGPSEVRSVRFAIRANDAGNHSVTLRGSAGDVVDAVVREVTVRPDGEPNDETASGTLDQEGVTHALTVPEEAIDGGTSLTLTLTPGFAADAAKGVESMLQEPNGCFEQTTATAWPNTLVAHYLIQAGALTDEKREETMALLTRGYQRLLTFESPTGGYNWWGDTEPGNRILSAIMLWHLKDLEELIEIDTAVRDRTLQWLLGQQNADGSFASGDALHAGNEVLGTSVARTTAFIAWALAHTGWADDAVVRATAWLTANVPGDDDLYAKALVGNALAAAAPQDVSTQDVFASLDALKTTGDDGQVVWQSGTPSWTGAAGDMTSVEATGLVAYGMMKAGSFQGSADGAIRFILSNKDSIGTWYNTQATMNSLRALSAAVKPDTSDTSGTLLVTINGEAVQEIVITPDQSDVFRTIDLSEFALVGDNAVELAFDGEGELNYQLTRRAYLPGLPSSEGPLSLEVTYDTVEAPLGGSVQVLATAVNNDGEGQRDQVIVRVGRAPGFEPRQEDLSALVTSGLVSRFEVQKDDVTLYLMALQAGEARALPFRLTPTLVVDALAPSSSIYAYYQPNLVDRVPAQRFVVLAQ
jgi:alpha-2-macroglobulin-like protein